ncbi:hypothetical protein CPB97_002034 [Podila verticillata]|nr:hypothetical protein CPB97_002034 [Podila verticillata]
MTTPRLLSPTQRPPPRLLPEIFTHIGQYLDRNTLVSCIRASKEFHNVFVPVLWHTFDDFIYYHHRHGCNSFNTCTVHGGPASCNITPLCKYGHNVRHLRATVDQTVLALASDPTVCARLHSLVLPGALPSMFPLKEVSAIFDEHRRVLGATYQPIDENLRQLSKSPHYDWLGGYLGDSIAKVVFLTVLRNANTLTKLHIGDTTNVLCYFNTIDAFYKMFASLHVLSDLMIPGKGISIPFLIQTLPRLKVLYFCNGAYTVANYHQADGDWCVLDETREGSTAATMPSLLLEKLVLECRMTFAETRLVLKRFPTIDSIWILLDDRPDSETDPAPLDLFRRAKDVQIHWTNRSKAPAQDLVDDALIVQALEAGGPRTAPDCPFVRIRRLGDRWP